MKLLKRISFISVLFFALFIFNNHVNATGSQVTSNGNLVVPVQATLNYDYSKEVLKIVNNERANNNLSPLTVDKELTECAMQRAVECSISFSHTRPNGSSCFSISNRAFGENIAMGYFNPPHVMQGWMNSAPHRSNILTSSFKAIGIGCANIDGYYFWVQLFSFYDSTDQNIKSGSQQITAGVEVPMDNFRVTLNGLYNNELEIGKEATINATGDFDGQTFELDNSNIKYTLSDSSVASVTNGKIKALKQGTVTLTSQVGDHTYTNTINIVPKQLHVYYRTHVQDVGWQNYVRDGASAGTSGRSLRLEAINVYLDNLPVSGGIEYNTHIQNIGWQGYKKNKEMSGTSGKSLRLEAIKIRLTGNLANNYDIYYRVHCQNIGWMGWAKNGESAGTAGFSYRLEAIEIKVVEKNGSAPGSTSNKFKQNINYQTHVQSVGWQGYVNSGVVSGTFGQSLRLEAIRIKVENTDLTGNVEYCTHIQDVGWEKDFSKKNGAISGTSGRSLRLEAIKIRLTGNLANNYDIYYRVHCQNIGWMGWAKNGESAGTAGYSYRLEGIQIQLVEKGDPAPANTGNTASAFQEQIPKKTTTSTSNTSAYNPNIKQDYLLVTSMQTFHKTDCGSGQRASSRNKQIVNEYRDVLISRGCKPCGNCNP